VPPAAIRGPLLVEGILQTLAGTALALVLLLGAFGLATARYGTSIAQAFGQPSLTFLSLAWVLTLIGTSLLVGALAGLGAAWKQS
jgi:cell division protein FtsX